MRLDTIGINYSARKIWVQDIMKIFVNVQEEGEEFDDIPEGAEE